MKLRLQLLLEVIPGRHEVAVLLNPDTPYSRLALEEAKAAAEYGHLRLEVLEARTAKQVAQIEHAAGTAAAGLLIFEDPLIYSIRGRVADLAAQFRLPAMYVYRHSVEAGGSSVQNFTPPRSAVFFHSVLGPRGIAALFLAGSGVGSVRRTQRSANVQCLRHSREKHRLEEECHACCH